MHQVSIHLKLFPCQARRVEAFAIATSTWWGCRKMIATNQQKSTQKTACLLVSYKNFYVLVPSLYWKSFPLFLHWVLCFGFHLNLMFRSSFRLITFFGKISDPKNSEENASSPDNPRGFNPKFNDTWEGGETLPQKNRLCWPKPIGYVSCKQVVIYYPCTFKQKRENIER